MEKEEFLKYLGKQMKRIRKEKGISQREFEYRGSIDRSQLSKIEKGEWNPTIFTIRKIADQLGITLEEFFKGYK